VGKNGKKRRRCPNGQEKQGRENDCGEKASGEDAWWKGARQESQGRQKDHVDLITLAVNMQGNEAVSRRPRCPH
jgi:hypothetical protein